MRIQVYDATLTEGARAAGIGFSARDKLRVAVRLGEMGVAWVELGWAGAGETELFRLARGLPTGEARLSACAGLRLGGRDEPEIEAALRTGAPAVTIFAPVWARRVGSRAGRAPARIAAAVKRVRAAGRAPIVDLGDFFDALRERGAAALAGVEAAARAGAEGILLSDTLGGALPSDVEAGVAAARRVAAGVALGVRARNDGGLAVASTLAAVARGASLVAGTINGFGERCGAADLVSVLPALELKMGRQALRRRALRQLTSLAHFVAELADQPPARRQPYAGRDAFAQGSEEGPPLHHVDPEAVGNHPELAMADARGHPRALEAARALGLDARGPAAARRVLARLAAWERRGFRYEGAEASFELLLRALSGPSRSYFRLLSYHCLDIHPRDAPGFTEAIVEVVVGDERVHTAARGVGPVHALDGALRKALEGHYPELKDLRLVDARSRNLASTAGSAAAVRVILESADARDRWGTAGVSENLIEACCQALTDAIEYKLLKDEVAPSRTRLAARRGR